MDWVPGLSQAKSLFQLVCGDFKEAAKTQANFFQECPGFSQITSTVQLAVGDTRGAIKTQKKCLKTVSNFADGIPVVGLAKGVIHEACGDSEGARNAIESSIRTTGVIAGGLGGFLVGGPVGAAIGGAAGGVAIDGTFTGIESALNDEYSPHGTFHGVTQLVKGKASSGDVFDLVMTPTLDAVSGYTSAKSCAKLVDRIETNRQLKNSVPRHSEVPRSVIVDDMKQLAKKTKKTVKQVKAANPEANIKGVTSSVLIDEHGNTLYGESRRLRRAAGRVDPWGSEGSRLNKTNPNAQRIVRRPFEACAEHEAFQSTKRGIKYNMSVQTDGTNFYPVDACQNCQQFSALGENITKGMDVGPKNPNKTYVPMPGERRNAALATGGGVLSEAFVCMDESDNSEDYYDWHYTRPYY